MPTVPIETSLAHLAGLGFDAVEIVVLPGYTTALANLDAGERRRIAGLLKEHRLALSAVSSYLSMLEQDPERFARNLAQVQGAIDLAVAWAQDGQPPVVITGIGGKPGQLETLQDQLIERVEALGDYAQARGVTVAVEHHIGTVMEWPDQAVAFIKQVKSPAIRFNFDISHFNILGIAIEESVAKMVPYAAHTHVKDERGRYPDYEYVIPGEGEFDYVRYLKAMAGHGYTGFISVEISKMVQRRPDYDPLAAASQSYHILSRAFAEAGLERS
jgi:sugar phosphate isomerase/epimerase